MDLQSPSSSSSSTKEYFNYQIALNQAANIAGYHFNLGSDMNEYEHTFIGDIVQAVSNKIKRAPLHVVDYPVGLESRVRKVNSLLNEACNDGVCMIGIHGIGGIEDMGKEIVRKESHDHPEKRTRLWFHKDIVEVLEENKGTSKTKMIYLDCPSKEVVINWNGEGFEKMTNLKTLVIKNANFSKASQYLPSSLRVLEWDNYPSSSTPFSIMNKKLENMKVLKFDNCKYLTKISNVSCLPNLEEFSFKNCENLITIDNSIGFLSKLKLLNAKGCTELRSFPPLKLPSLIDMDISCCKSLQNFPEILDKMENLGLVFICGTSIQEIPVSFQNLTGLYIINLEICGKLMFPSSIICNMPSVEYVYLLDSNLSLCLPMVIKWFTNMTQLNLSGSDFRILPECLKEFTSLHSLTLDDCHSLEDICALPPNLGILSALKCKSLNSSSKSMLVNKISHESRRATKFGFPSAESEMIRSGLITKVEEEHFLSGFVTSFHS
ncbi:disease resistance protein RUN1 [Trifolium repens]|nr:disease resistance protein RUN1 [Trifolium repens]